MRILTALPLVLVAWIGIALAADAHAQSLAPNDPLSARIDGPDTEAPGENHVMLGAVALAYRSPFLGEGTSVLPIPIVSIRQGIFYADGLEAGVELAPEGESRFTPSIGLFVAARAIAGTNRERITADAGVRASLETPAGTFSLSYRRDVTGVFDGGQFDARYSVDLAVGPVTVTPALQASWLDRATANHMYGTTPRQRQRLIDSGAAVVLPVYAVPKDSLNLGGDLTMVWPLNAHLAAIASAGGTWLDKPIRLNPGLRDEFEAQVMVGLAYRF